MTAKEKLTAKVASLNADQLAATLTGLAKTYTPEAAIVRGAVYMRLCEVMGDDAADALYESLA